jgi:hypothetical protein
MQGARYCRTECLELALADFIARARPAPCRAAIASHRIPLGLLLISRQQLTAAQLRIALEAQRGTDRGGIKMKIGAWLQQLGFATEEQVTGALARQWSCPVLRSAPVAMSANSFPAIPVLLLEIFRMMPVEFVVASRTLLIAFSEGIDHTVLYAVEQMLGYRTEACLVCPSTLQKSLQALVRDRGAGDVVFDGVADAGECAHIIGNYAGKLKAEEVRMARCGEHLWVRLERLGHDAVNLLLRAGH